jgi:phage baseplate assembly protein W
MGSYSFKSVGRTNEKKTLEQIVNSPVPYGIKTPLQLGTSEGILAMHYNLPDQVHDNLRNLLLTNWGERVEQYFLGANLRPLLAEWVSQDDFDAQALERINAAVQRWMPYVGLIDYLSEVDNTQSRGIGVVRVTITYNVPALQVKQRALQLLLRVM